PLTAADLHASSSPQVLVEHTAFDGVVATFTDAEAADTAAGFSTAIHWGDGSADDGTVTGGPGTFAVHGSHTYAEPGSYLVTVFVQGNDDVWTSTATTFVVTDPPLVVAGAPALTL